MNNVIKLDRHRNKTCLMMANQIEDITQSSILKLNEIIHNLDTSNIPETEKEKILSMLGRVLHYSIHNKVN